MKICAVLMGLVAAAAAHAERPVYRGFDDNGGVVYSDRPSQGSVRVKSWSPANPSRFEYDSAALRAESERAYYERQQAGERMPRPVLFIPARSAPATLAPADLYAVPYRLRPRFDPNLPDSPPPSLERRYYYDGR